MANFDQAIPIVLEHEGGYVNDPDDAGGETKYGISKRSYPNLDIANLTEQQAADIYRRDFWNPLLLDQFAAQDVATKVFDTAVLMGKSRAVKFLQHCVGCTPDGVIGVHTVTATNDAAPGTILPMYKSLLDTYYEGLVQAIPKDAKFLRGWLARADS